MSDPTAFQCLIQAVNHLNLPPETGILVAVSGGPDSVALLRALLSAAPPGWQIRVAHVNHRLRGEESDADERFVRDLAAQYGLPCLVAAVDTNDHALGLHLSLETAARDLRHETLRRMLRDWHGDVIALGHNEGDQAETVLMRLLRGTGPAGLAAMLPRSGRLVRPFLSVDRPTIVRALEELNQPYRVDSSNTDPRFLRNRIRHEMMPLLRTIRPDATRLLARTAAAAGLERDFMESQARDVLRQLTVPGEDSRTVSVSGWRALHPALQAATLRLLVRALLPAGAGLSYDEIQRLGSYLNGDAISTRGSLPYALRVEISGNFFQLTRDQPNQPSTIPESRLSVPGEFDTGHGRISARLVESDAAAASLSRWQTVLGPWHAIFPIEVVGTGFLVRSRRPGDRISCLPGGHSRKLQDLMVEQRIPRTERDLTPVIEGPDGIIWVPGVARMYLTAAERTALPAVHLVYYPKLAHIRDKITR